MFKFFFSIILLMNIFAISIQTKEWKVIDDFDDQFKNLTKAVFWTVTNIYRVNGFSMPLSARMFENGNLIKFNFILGMDLKYMDAKVQVNCSK